MTILASAAKVLRCFSHECAEISVTELVNRLSMPKSNASRLLRSMRDAGLLETVGASKRYRPSLMLVDVGRSYRRASTLVQRADEVVARVSARCGHTGYVSQRDGLEITAVTDHPGSNSLRVVSSVGRRLPAFASATGRSLLARLTDEQVSALYGGRLPPAPSTTSPQDMADLFERLARIRESGVALSHDEANRGVAAVAVAVGAQREEVSLCIVFPAATCDPAERDQIALDLREGAAEIARIVNDPSFLPLGVPAARKAA